MSDALAILVENGVGSRNTRERIPARVGAIPMSIGTDVRRDSHQRLAGVFENREGFSISNARR